MKLSQVEQERSGLVRFLVVLIMIFLAAIMFISYRQQQGVGIPVLAVLSLMACLYALVKERSLRARQSVLVDELIRREAEVRQLGVELEQEHADLVEEKDRSERLDVRLHEVAHLYRAISAVNAVRKLSEVPDAVLTAALRLVDGDCGSIMLLDDARKNLVIARSQGLGKGIPERTKLPVGEGIAGWVAEHEEPLLLSGSLEGDERFKNRVADRTVQIAMSVPLELRGKVIGVLNIGSTDEEARANFADWHLRMATIFGQHASVALRSAQLTTTLREHGLLSPSGV